MMPRTLPRRLVLPAEDEREEDPFDKGGEERPFSAWGSVDDEDR